MKPSSVFLLTLLFYVSYAKVTINNFENCDPNADYPIKMSFKLGEKDGMQILEEGHLSSTVPLGNNILDIAEVSSKEESGYEHLVTIKENLCDAMNKYMGEFMHDIQEAAGLARGTCPVPAGDYKVKDHALDFQKVKIKSTKIPEGDYRVKVSLMDANSNDTLHCHFIDFNVEK